MSNKLSDFEALKRAISEIESGEADGSNKTPAYQKLDVEPNKAGENILGNLPERKEDFSKQKREEVEERPIFVKADSLKQEEDDKFYPPLQNFSAIGSTEHAWYSEEVTGVPSSSNKEDDGTSKIIDNNDFVDIEGLQGTDPLNQVNEDVAKKLHQYFNDKFEKIYLYSEQNCKKSKTKNDITYIKERVLGPNGLAAGVAAESLKLDKDQRVAVTSLVKSYLVVFKELFNKYEDLKRVAEENEPVHVYESTEYKDPSSGKNTLLDLDEDTYQIFIDDKPVKPSLAKEELKIFLNRLVLSDNVDMDRVKVFKRVSLDFGILIKD